MQKFFMLLLCTVVSLNFIGAQRTVTGNVVGSDGTPLIGANVIVKGTTDGTITDIDGKFSIPVAEGRNTITVSYTGFVSRDVNIAGLNFVNVTLQEGQFLDEVIVVGYGEGSRKANTTSISSIDSKVFDNLPVQSFQGGLAGAVPGLTVNQSSGTLGAQSAVRIRGVGSINASNQPLYVIDGLILSDVVSGTGFGGPGTNPLININPNDIASIDVLKDAAATAIYGSRGSNGVIIITTKRGDYNAAPKVSINYYTGTAEPTKTYDLLNGEQYVELWNAGGGPPYDYGSDPIPSTDWIDLVTRKGRIHEVSAGVSGGSASTSYYLGGTFRDEEGYVLNTNLKRYSFRASIDQKIGKKGKVGITMNPTRSENVRAGEDNAVASPFTFGALANPNTNYQDENGNPLTFLETNIPVFNGTPWSNILGSSRKAVTSQLLANVYAEYNILDNLKFRTDFGTESTQLQELGRELSNTTDGFPTGSAFGDNEQVINYSWSNRLEYTTTFSEVHNAKFTVGSAVNRERFDGIDVSGLNFADDRLLTLNSAAEINGGGGSRTDASFAGFFGRVNYDFDNKYFVTLAGRYDGSSRFGIENRWGFFPAVSAGWIISNEDWFGSSNIGFLKLRASWGQSGNGEIGNFDSKGLIGFGRDYNAVPGFAFTQLENANLGWEKNSQIDAAVEFELFNRISGSLGYFIKNTTDLLLSVPQPREIGIENASLLQNVGEIRNQGLEFDLDFNILTGDDFSWSIGVNGATLSNEVTKLIDNDGDGEDDDIIAGQHLIRVGEALGSFYLVEYAGVDAANGNALFLDDEGQTTDAYPSSARTVAGSPIPSFTGGVTTNLNYKGFDLFALMQISQGNDVYWSDGRFVETNFASLWNQTTRVLDAWTPENTDGSLPEIRVFQANGSQHSTRYLSDGSFMRLKNIQVGYTFKNIGGKDNSIRVFVGGNNLLTITDYRGLDPEASFRGAGSYRMGETFFSRPQSKRLIFGVNVTL